MRIGEKCVFIVDKDMFGGKIKAGHKYVGKCAGDMLVSYRNCLVQVKSIKKVEKSPIKKEKAPTASDYKDFGDLCFEVAIRYRDNWTSVISGKKFEEGDWNGLQAGHGCSRTYWDTRHNPMNCHAITSGENYQMSLGNATTIAKYWAAVSMLYGTDISDKLIFWNHKSTKLSISYLKDDCRIQYEFLKNTLNTYLTLKTKKFVSVDPDYYIKWRCEKYPKTKADGVLKVLDLIERGEI